MKEDKLIDILRSLREQSKETEIFEFKRAEKDYDFKKLGQYFSALSNEANLKGVDCAWLVFGIDDQSHEVKGSNYRSKGKRDLNSLKKEIADKTTNRISFIDIHVLNLSEGRVIMFQIPPAPNGIPVAFNDHYYGRDDESLVGLSLEKIDRIRSQNQRDDWSAVIVSDATLNDLDSDAIYLARKNFKNKFPDKAKDVDKWDDITFLNKAKITIKNKITRTALILLGKDESEHFLTPSEVKIRWKLVDENNRDVDYEIFGIPLIISVERVYSKIRNIKYRYMQEGTIFPTEVSKYEPFTIREAINNCIAHQDYTKNARINIIEKEDELIFTNQGSFIPGNVERVVIEDAPEEYYRNRFLASAMFNLKMVDTAGGGIKKMFNYQRERFFPLPEYDLSNNRVSVVISGKILDMEYARLLAQNKDLALEEIIMLDKVQKKKPLTKEEVKHLRERKLIEGRKPNFYISIKVAQKTGQKADYSKNKGFEKAYYLDLITKSLKEHKTLERKDIDQLLIDKLPEWMSPKQKKTKVGNLLTELRKKDVIENKGSFAKPKWELINKKEI